MGAVLLTIHYFSRKFCGTIAVVFKLIVSVERGFIYENSTVDGVLFRAVSWHGDQILSKGSEMLSKDFV